ncbi:ekc/keops complex subunit tprkb [Quercus suber]|uniref:Ekc/keops complex subunit tprkb n=1 Tax=Quercus suber TaxID=58331 RepID=A0AAW0JJH4_QUESU
MAGESCFDCYVNLAKMIPDVFPVLAAAHKTLVSKSRESLTTRTLHSELVFNYSGSKHITESLKRCGISESTTYILAARFNATLDEIPDVFPVLAAAHKTLVSKSRESLTTRTLHSELVFNYSGSKHITESLKRCGISESTTYILAARFNATLDEVKAVEKLIHGKEIDLEELKGRANQAQIQKQYKITGPELGISSLADAIVCRIAARDAL